jgi:hypothetical protein
MAAAPKLMPTVRGVTFLSRALNNAQEVKAWLAEAALLKQLETGTGHPRLNRQQAKYILYIH